MKIVFQAENIAEARMIADMLEREGIQAEIEGEHLAGAAGGVPAMGMVKVLVPENDAKSSEELISSLRWNESAPDERKSSSMAWKSLLFLLSGAVLGAAGTVVALRTPANEYGLDRDRDGNYEERWFYAGNALLRIEYDRNDDGAVDSINGFDRQGFIKETRHDANHDGRFEWHTSYRHGWYETTRGDVDGDGFDEWQAHFENGDLVFEDARDPVTQKTRVRYYSCSDVLVAANVDTDGDGSFDRSVRYASFGLEDGWENSLFDPDRESCETLLTVQR